MAKILYVEDNPDNFRLVKTLLEKSGYNVVGAADGMEGITRAREERPDLILMDINIPNLTGYEVTTRIKSIQGLEKVPVVALTAKTMKGDKDLALAAGCVGFIPKPIDPFHFVQDMESFLKGREDRIPIIEEQSVLREYSRKLVTNLEEKVTQLQEFNRKLQESEERYRTLVENVNIGIWFLSPLRETLFLNQRMRDVLKVGAQDPVSPDSFLEAEDDRIFQDHLQRCADGNPQLWETRFNSPDGRHREVVVSGVVIRSANKEMMGYLLSILDVTEKRELERHLEQVHKLESLSTLTAGVAHDFNNILTIILNNADMLLQKGGLPPEELRKINNVASAARRGSSLTSQLLAFSRETPPNLQMVDPLELLQRFCKFFTNYKRNGVNLRYPTYSAVPAIQADPVQLEQVLLNLATNAQDAMPDGGLLEFDIRLESRARNTALGERTSGEYVCLIVRDTGAGIDPAIRHKIFEPFFTTKPPGKGTGLGLSAVFGIIKRHNGFIEVDSKPNHGSEFRLYIPEADEKPTMPGEVDLRILRQGKYGVLVVEDEEMLGDLLCEMLMEIGIQVFLAENMPKAEHTLETKLAHLNFIILDYGMPLLEVRPMIQRLRRLAPGMRIILTSGHSREDIAAREGPLAIDGFLKKPFDMKAVVELFKRLV